GEEHSTSREPPSLTNSPGDPNGGAPDPGRAHDAETVEGTALEPVWVPEWPRHLLERYAVEERINRRNERLRQRGRALLPPSQPLVIGQSLAFRSLRGLQVRDLVTGRLKWEQRLADSPEEVHTRQRFSDWELDPVDAFVDDREIHHDSHQLANLLYRDSVYGGL